MADGTKNVLITGAAKRIGRVVALDFARHGWNVAVHYRSSGDEAEELAGEIAALGVRAVALRGDLGNVEDVTALVPACTAKLGAIQCLVNNASEFSFDTIEELTPESWNLHLDINLKAPVFLAQAMARDLPESSSGSVINIIDQRVWNLTPEFFSYTVSKAGLWSATRMLAQALAPRIRVNAIGPGPVLKSVHQTAEDFEREVDATLLQRGVSPEEIAQAIRFILDAEAMTGQMVALDGGQHLAWSNGGEPPHNPTVAPHRPKRPLDG